MHTYRHIHAYVHSCIQTCILHTCPQTTYNNTYICIPVHSAKVIIINHTIIYNNTSATYFNGAMIKHKLLQCLPLFMICGGDNNIDKKTE